MNFLVVFRLTQEHRISNNAANNTEDGDKATTTIPVRDYGSDIRYCTGVSVKVVCITDKGLTDKGSTEWAGAHQLSTMRGIAERKNDRRDKAGRR